MIKRLGILMIMMAQFLAPPKSFAQSVPVLDAGDYILGKLSGHDIVFTGTVHQQPVILQLMAGLMPL